MIKKERAARIAAQQQAAELRKLLTEERAKNTASREVERLRIMSALVEEHQHAAEERRQAAEDRRAFLSVLTELTAELAYLRQQRNGGMHNGQ